MRRAIQILSAAAIASLTALSGCGKSYPQASPEALIASAQEMVQDGQAHKLVDLIYAENEPTRALYNRVGVLLGHLQILGAQIQEAYPEELEKLRKEAQAAAERGEVPNFLARLTQAGASARRGRSRDDQSEVFGRTILQLLADPYVFLKSGEGRLGTNPIADDMAVLTWDGQTVLPPLGVLLKEVDGDWFLMPPTSLPFVSRLMPQNEDEFKIFASLVKVFDNAVIDVTEDVQSGNAKTLEDVARMTGEKLVAPAFFAFLAFGKAIEAREEETQTDSG